MVNDPLTLLIGPFHLSVSLEHAEDYLADEAPTGIDRRRVSPNWERC